MEWVWSSGWSVGLGVAIGLLLAALVWAAVGWSRRGETVLEQPVPHGVDTALEVIGATGVVLDADNRGLRAAQTLQREEYPLRGIPALSRGLVGRPRRGQ